MSFAKDNVVYLIKLHVTTQVFELSHVILGYFIAVVIVVSLRPAHCSQQSVNNTTTGHSPIIC